VSTPTVTFFCQLSGLGLISFSGEDAVSFLHAQLTSDVATLGDSRTQYSGYCSPKGRLLAACLLWPRDSAIVMALPAALRDSVQTRLAKYVLRARVRISDASAELSLFGIAGEHAAGVIVSLCGGRAPGLYEIVTANDERVTRLPIDRYLVLVPTEKAAFVRETLLRLAGERDESAWSALDVEAGIPVIPAGAQDEYVPQMVNLDLVGGVSYTKGCYPGQEIVARMHYLGKLKQRMYRVRVAADRIDAGDPLYSAEFGAGQASGSILYGNRGTHGDYEALAVVQKSAVESGSLHFKSLNGPAVEILPLPYPIPA
jgi:folate-binding protein YgfZ